MGLRPRIWPHLLHLVMKAMEDRLLGCSFCPHLNVVRANGWEARRPSGLVGTIHADSSQNGEVRPTSERIGWSLLFIWSVSFVWLNQTDQIDQMNQINPRSSRFSRQSRPSRLS